ncbi:MAG: polysaccharide biosynthesis tyrosine autokinase [Actinomycetota bacterium]|nr:polysaccharide biosynthesis tyrosine autokinase [Actinomycetota bacterium]
MNTEPPSTLNVERALRVLRRRGPIVLICMVVAAASAFVFANGEKKQYTAAASLLFTNNQLAAVASGLTAPSSPLTQAQQDTNVKLVSLGDVAAKTAAQIGPKWTAGMVHRAVSAAADSDTNIVVVSATASSPLLAQRLANTYSQVFVTEQQATSVASLMSAKRLVDEQYNALGAGQRASSQGLALADRSQSLGTLSKLENGNVGVVGTAGLPTSPTAPKVSRDTTLGAVIGLLIGLGLAFVLERLDRRIRDPKELESVYEFPLLAVVPERSQYQVLSSLGQLAQRGTGRGLIYDEVFNLLRSYLRYFAVDRNLQTLLIISAGGGEGKTTVSYNLGKAAAALGSRVLLVEGDLRRGTIIGPLLAHPSPGLSDVLIGDAKMDEAVHSIEVGPKGVLDVLIAGEIPPPNATELTESRAMQSMLESARAAYDLVVIDTPPLNLIADAIPLLTQVDGVIVVGRIGKTRRDAAEQLRKKLTALRAPVLGIVANGAKGRGTNPSGYGYGYSGATPPSSNGSAASSAESRTPEDVPETA